MLPALLLAAAVQSPTLGAQLYTTRCASCHAANFRGTANGPSLAGSGMANLDFYLSTGRMPAAVPWLQVEHQQPQLRPEQIAAIEAYLAPAVGGPPIPQVVAGAPLDRGRDLFQAECEHCHGAKGDGGALGGVDWVPDIHHDALTQIAEAIRIGPGQMPPFGEQQLSADDLNAVATYVLSLSVAGEKPDVPPFTSTGPVPEGAIGWAGVVLLVVFVFTFWRSDATRHEREETVRPDAPSQPPRR